MASLLMLASCAQEKADKVPAIDLTDLDTSVAPGEDFFRYADGGWIAKNPLKPEYARFGSFDVLRERNVERLNDLFSEMTKLNPEKGSVEQKIVDLYRQGLDSVRLNSEGAEPLKKYLDQIAAVDSKSALARLAGRFYSTGIDAFFSGWVDADFINSDLQMLYVQQGGLGMGDRDYYVDPKNAELHKGYQEMLAKLCGLAGVADPEQTAANAVAVEDALAGFSWTSVECRDIQRMYNPMSTAGFEKAYPGFDFAGYFAEVGIPDQEKLIVMMPSFFEGFSSYFEKTDLEVLKDYVVCQVINGASGALSDDFYAASFDFYSRQMSGITEQKPRWKRAMSVPNSCLGEAVGKMYVEKYFPEEYKEKVLAIVGNLKSSLGKHIEALDWMTDATKAKALEKLEAFTVKIGYPDKWKDYSTLAVDPEASYFDNLCAAQAWYVADGLSRLGKPTDRSEWGMTPQTVNAYYNPTSNEICFPAAILQPPFFNADADDAVNYGAIGVVIGHEMTHGFDDQGRLFDKYGNMNGWWTPEDEAAFKAKTAILEDQYNKVEILPGLFANGALSLGENIADQGGVGVAFTALQSAMGGNRPADIDGFTAEQRFFLGFAHVWATNTTDEEKARLTKLDVHSLAENRVNVTLRNFQEFFDAFGIKEGDKMWRPESERVMIW